MKSCMMELQLYSRVSQWTFFFFLGKSALTFRETLATTREYVPRKALSLIVDGKPFIPTYFQ